MSYQVAQAPVLVVASAPSAALQAALSDAKFAPLVESNWDDVHGAVERLRPAAVVAEGGSEQSFERLGTQLAALQPYVPLIAIDPSGPLPSHALRFATPGRRPDRLGARLRAALRVRALHATILRRLESADNAAVALPETDPLLDASVLLIGRGATYPALSVALGERLGVLGALSIEAAARQLNLREVDGIVLADGFTPRVVEAFLTVLAEDARFRNLPIILTVPGATADHDLPNLEPSFDAPDRAAADAMPLIRQHAFEARLGRTLTSLDAGGLIEPRTGLLTQAAFARDFAAAIEQTLSRGGGLSVARFALNTNDQRARFDAARIVSRLMRRTDFGVLAADQCIVTVFAEADLRCANAIARRLSSVLRQSAHSARRESRIDPEVTLATLRPGDTPSASLDRLLERNVRRAAS